MAGTVATGLAAAMKAAADAAESKPRFAVPAGAVDCHVHILDPARFALAPKRAYTPGPATVAMLRKMHAKLGIKRTVVIQNSVYGADNSCILDALKQLGTYNTRGVVTLLADVSAADIAAFDKAGVRGCRINLSVSKDNDTSKARSELAIGKRLPPHWHVHINAPLPVLAAVDDAIAALPSAVVLDHFAHTEAKGGPNQPGVDRIVALMKSGKVFLKLSGPYQISDVPGYGDVAPIARMYLAAAPGQVIWGSDWPHTGGAGRPANQPPETFEPFRPEDDGYNLSLLATWAPDAALRHRVLVETPTALYGFAPVKA